METSKEELASAVFVLTPGGRVWLQVCPVCKAEEVDPVAHYAAHQLEQMAGEKKPNRTTGEEEE